MSACIAYKYCGVRISQGFCMYLLPKDENVKQQWMDEFQKADVPINKNQKLCEKHFTDDQFDMNRSIAKYVGIKQMKLKKNAVPTIFDSVQVTADEDIEEDDDDGVSSTVSREILNHVNYLIDQKQEQEIQQVNQSTNTPQKSTSKPKYFTTFESNNTQLVTSDTLTNEFPYGRQISPNPNVSRIKTKNNTQITSSETPIIRVQIPSAKNNSSLNVSHSKKSKDDLHWFVISSSNPYSDFKDPCGICGRVYNRNFLPRHIAIHGPKHLSCDMCARTFRQMERLVKHKRIHHIRDKCSCGVCGKLLSTPCSLIRHVRIHSGSMPYNCNICGKSFRQLELWCTHMLLHGVNNPYKCAECGMGFNQSKLLKQHIKTHIKKVRIGYSYI